MKRVISALLFFGAIAAFADTPGQVINKTCSAHQWFNSITNTAPPVCAQPQYSDIGGSPPASITSINGQTAAAQLITVGSSGSDFNITQSGLNTNILNLPIASASNTGKLSSGDWSTFNSKQSALTFGSISTSTSGVSIGSGTNATVGPNVTLDVQTASGTQPGLLSAADWSTFNAKQPAGSYITALTSDVSASGPGSASATVNSVGGSSAANIHSAELAANAATSANTVSTIVKRDSSGNFSAGTITAGQVIDSGLTASTVPYADASKQLTSSAVSPTELGYVSGVTSAIQTQLNGKQATGNYITALTGDVSASGPGSATATLANTAVSAGSYTLPSITVDAKGRLISAATGTVSLTSQVTGLLPLANTASYPVVQVWTVDGTRTDSYTEDGSIQRPYKTIMGAINAIISAGLNSSSHLDYINIVGPGSYAENLTLNDTHLVNIFMNGNDVISVSPVSGDSLSSTTNNDGLLSFVSQGMTFTNGVTFTGASNATTFCEGTCSFAGGVISGNVNITNANAVLFFDEHFDGDINWTNVKTGEVSRGDGQNPANAFTLTWNAGNNKPVGSSSTSVTVEGTLTGAPTTTATTTLQYREASRVGGSGTSCSISGTLTDYNSMYRCNMTVNSGGTWTQNGTYIAGTTTNNGTITVAGKTTQNIVNGASAATNAVIVFKDGHLKSTTTTAPTTTVGNAGTGATCTLAHATDMAGIITLVSGSVGTPSTGTQCTINFNKSFATIPVCVMTPANSNAASNLVLYSVGTTTTAAFPFSFGVAAGTSTTYIYTYHCMETQ